MARRAWWSGIAGVLLAFLGLVQTGVARAEPPRIATLVATTCESVTSTPTDALDQPRTDTHPALPAQPAACRVPLLRPRRESSHAHALTGAPVIGLPGPQPVTVPWTRLAGADERRPPQATLQVFLC